MSATDLLNCLATEIDRARNAIAINDLDEFVGGIARQELLCAQLAAAWRIEKNAAGAEERQLQRSAWNAVHREANVYGALLRHVQDVGRLMLLCREGELGTAPNRAGETRRFAITRVAAGECRTWLA